MSKSIEGRLVGERMRVSAKGRKEAPTLPGTFYRFMLKHPPLDFLAAGPDATPRPDVPGPAPAANSSNREPYVLMLMPKTEAQVPDAQVAVPKPTTAVVPELATAVDVADTPTDAAPPENFGAASEITPDESPDQVSGLVEHFEHFRLPGAAVESNGGTGAGEGDGGALGRALALKAEGNQHFSTGEYSPALPLYSKAIEMLEGAGEDAALAIILCNRSAAYLKLGQSASALTDAERAGALGGGMKAHFRRGEALLSMRRYEEALEAFEAALKNAVSDCAGLTHCFLD